MFVYTLKFDKKKAAFAVIMAALVIIGIIMLVGAHDQRQEITDTGAVVQIGSNAKNEKHRVSWLSQQGWAVESPALSEDSVVIPRTFSSVFETYNELQKEQGFDLTQYSGRRVKRYTYTVTNYPGREDVVAALLIYKNRIVGGQIQSTDGTILHGLSIPVPSPSPSPTA